MPHRHRAIPRLSSQQRHIHGVQSEPEETPQEGATHHTLSGADRGTLNPAMTNLEAIVLVADFSGIALGLGTVAVAFNSPQCRNIL